jgi:type I restriction enzyme S subunit
MVDIPLTFSKYLSLGSTEVNYLPSLPTHWHVEKGKWLFKKENRPVQQEDEVITCFRDGEVTLRSNRRTEGFTNALLEHGYQGIRKNDLVIHAMDAFAGAIGVSDSDGKSSPVYAACTPINPKLVNPYFYAYFMRDLAVSGYLASLAKGIRERSTDFRFKDFSELLLPIPPIEEQFLIVEFLDQKLKKADSAIQVKERQIERLKERKQILTQQVVTRGLDPRATMRDSGIEWIGEIPTHWEILRLKYLFNEKNERTKTGEETLLSLRMELGLVPHDDVSDKTITNENLVDYKIVRPGQMVMNRMRAAIGIFGVSSRFGLVSPDYAIFDIKERANPSFFLKLFKLPLLGTQFRLGSKGLGTGSSGFMRLYTEEFGTIKVAVPPIDEQSEILQFINSISEQLDYACTLLHQQITKLKEYKSTLTNSAVTGKIKVPGVVEPCTH